MTSTDALLQESTTLGKLYDAECIMSISESVAHGYLVLLGGLDQSGKAQAEKDFSLAFMALVQGNVLDACFGVQNATRRDDTLGTRAAREAKELIEEYGASESFRVAAVQAYANAFRAVIVYHHKCDKLNCITRCFRTKRLRVKCEKDLRESFLNLARSLADQR